MDYAMLPPEVNSGRMYTGPGSASLADAAVAWAGLGAELTAAADSYTSTLSNLAVRWKGPSASRMTSAATPYVAWLRDTAAAAEQASTGARAAADAYEDALAATVPPAAVAANRHQLASLVATNTFGQHTQAITLVEAQYAQMWAQDAEAMYGYAGSAAAATRLRQFISPPRTTDSGSSPGRNDAGNNTGDVSPIDIGSILSQLTLAPGSPAALNHIAVPPGLGPILDFLGPSSPLSLAASTLGTALRGLTVGSVALVNIIFGINLNMLFMQGLMSSIGLSSAVQPALSAASAEPGAGLTATLPAVSANVGGSALAGALSVPPSWAAATPTSKLVASALQAAAITPATPSAAAQSIPALTGQMALGGAAGGAVGAATRPAVTVRSIAGTGTATGKDQTKPSKFERVVAELSEKPEAVQHWHTDKAQLEGLLERLSKKPGTHAVHIHTGKKDRSAAPGPDEM